MIHRVLDRLLGESEKIDGNGVCPVHLYRWTLSTFGRFGSCYLHHFVGDDWSMDLHDHPKRFVSVGLWGSYVETTEAGRTAWRAPWIRSFPAEHRHRLSVPKSCWTLVFVLRRVRDWGFWVDGRWVHWRRYVDSEDAAKRKSRP